MLRRALPPSIPRSPHTIITTATRTRTSTRTQEARATERKARLLLAPRILARQGLADPLALPLGRSPMGQTLTVAAGPACPWHCGS